MCSVIVAFYRSFKQTVQKNRHRLNKSKPSGQKRKLVARESRNVNPEEHSCTEKKSKIPGLVRRTDCACCATQWHNSPLRPFLKHEGTPVWTFMCHIHRIKDYGPAWLHGLLCTRQYKIYPSCNHFPCWNYYPKSPSVISTSCRSLFSGQLVTRGIVKAGICIPGRWHSVDRQVLQSHSCPTIVIDGQTVVWEQNGFVQYFQLHDTI